MPNRLPLHKTNLLAAIGTCFIVGACTSTPSTPQPYVTPHGVTVELSSLRSSFHIESNDDTLTRQLQAAWQGHPHLFVVQESGYSDIRLEVISQQQTQTETQNTPRLFGRLKPVAVQPSAEVNFRLVDSNGTVLYQGQYTAVGKSEERFVGSLSQHNALSPSLASDATAAIVQQLQRPIQSYDWRTHVLGHQGPDHVMLGATQQSGLQLTQYLQTETQPVSTVEIVTFEQTASGPARAIGRLISGPLPRPGQSLIPAN